jgi:hypothetical protein
MNTTKEKIQVYISESVVTTLRMESAQNRLPMSWLVEEALIQYLAKKEVV